MVPVRLHERIFVQDSPTPENTKQIHIDRQESSETSPLMNIEKLYKLQLDKHPNNSHKIQQTGEN